MSQFNRQFKKKFHTTPRSYLTSVRMNAACHLLVSEPTYQFPEIAFPDRLL